jgi:hypothetical protein
VSGETNIDLTSQKTGDILSTVAVTNSSDLSGLKLLLNTLKNLLNDRCGVLGHVVYDPLLDGKVLGTFVVQQPGVSLEKVGHDDVVSVGGIGVGQQLGVGEFVADDVGEEEEDLGGGGTGNVGLDYMGD